MKTVYLDNCTAAFPKAPGVGEAMCRATLRPGRAEDGPAAVGEKLRAMVGAPQGSSVRFTAGLGSGWKELLTRLLQPGDVVLTSPMERGCLLRMLEELPGVTVELLPCTLRGELRMDELETRITDRVRAVVLTHASHVSGTVFPVGAVGELCRQRGVLFLVEAAQTAGVIPIDMQNCCIDGLVFPGYTGLLGPEGVGAFVMSPLLAHKLSPHLTPCGEPANLPGIAGLGAALDYLAEEGEKLRRRLAKLSGHLWARMKELDGEGLRVLGSDTPSNRIGLVSVVFTALPNEKAAQRLEKQYGIRCACGLLDAPLAHRTLGSYPQGAVRFSVSPFTDFREIDYLEGAVEYMLF